MPPVDRKLHQSTCCIADHTMFGDGPGSRVPLSALGPPLAFQSDDEETLEGFNSVVGMDLDDILPQAVRGIGAKEDGTDGLSEREKLVDADFFNAFDDDFDEDDMKLGD